MKRWVSTAIIGTGTSADPFRPDLKGKKSSYVVGAYGSGICLVKLVKPSPSGIIGASGVQHHGDEKQDSQGNWGVPAALRATLKAQAQALGAGTDWEPEGYNCSGD